MVSRHKIVLDDWYSRVVFGVIAVALAVLAGQGACSVQPVVAAQARFPAPPPCGSQARPCYVKFSPWDVGMERLPGGKNALAVWVANPQ